MSQKYTDNLNKQTQAGRGCDITCGFPREHVRVQGSLPFLRSARRRKNVSRSGRRDRRQGGAEVGWAGGWEWFAVAPVNRAKTPQKPSTSRTLHKPHTEQKTHHLLDFHLYVSLKVIIFSCSCGLQKWLFLGERWKDWCHSPASKYGARGWLA